MKAFLKALKSIILTSHRIKYVVFKISSYTFEISLYFPYVFENLAEYSVLFSKISLKVVFCFEHSERIYGALDTVLNQIKYDTCACRIHISETH